MSAAEDTPPVAAATRASSADSSSSSTSTSSSSVSPPVSGGSSSSSSSSSSRPAGPTLDDGALPGSPISATAARAAAAADDDDGDDDGRAASSLHLKQRPSKLRFGDEPAAAAAAAISPSKARLMEGGEEVPRAESSSKSRFWQRKPSGANLKRQSTSVRLTQELSKSGAKSRRKRMLLVIMMGFAVFAMAGVVFGWPPFLRMLVDERVYAEQCPANTVEFPCPSQANALNLIFTIAAVVQAMSGVAAGFVLDYLGPLVAIGISAVTMTVGCLMLAFKVEMISAYMFIPIAGNFIFLASFRSSFMIPEHQTLLLTAMSVLFDAAYVVFMVLQQLHGAQSFRDLLIGYLIVCLAIDLILVLLWLLNLRDYYLTSKTSAELDVKEVELVGGADRQPAPAADDSAGPHTTVELPARARTYRKASSLAKGFAEVETAEISEGEDDHDHDEDDDDDDDHHAEGTEGGARDHPTDVEQGGAAATAAVDQHLFRSPTGEAPSPVLAPSRSDDEEKSRQQKSLPLGEVDNGPALEHPEDMPLRRQLRTLEFIAILIYFSVHVLRSNTFLGVLGPFLLTVTHDKHQAEQYEAISGIIIIVLGVASALPVAWVIKRLGFVNTLDIVNLLTLTYTLLAFVPSPAAQMISVSLFAVVRAALFSVCSAYVVQIFGAKSMGRLTGVMWAAGGLAQGLQYGGVTLVNSVWSGSYTNLNIIFACLIASQFLLTFLVRIRSPFVHAERTDVEVAGH